MATGFVSLEGEKELIRKLNDLDTKVRGKLERKGTREGTKVFADDTRRRTPFRSGLMKSAITVRALKRKKGRVGYRVTFNTTAKGRGTKAIRSKRAAGGFYSVTKSGKKYFYPAIVEYGAKNQEAQAPMRQAFDSKKDAALQKVIVSIREGVRDATGK